MNEQHPLKYCLGQTQDHDFDLILIIGREPNSEGRLSNAIGVIDNEEFAGMTGGVWPLAYSQIAKQWLGQDATAGNLKEFCFKRSASPIVFTNAYPMAIPVEYMNKNAIRQTMIPLIPDHIKNIFNSELARRVKLVIQHGGDKSEHSTLATNLIKQECEKREIPYFAAPFFSNHNLTGIKPVFNESSEILNRIMESFAGATTAHRE